MLDTKYWSRWICCLVNTRYLLSEAHSCSIKVQILFQKHEDVTATSCLLLPLLPSTLLGNFFASFLQSKVRSGWVSYSHQRRWQWLERCKWPQQSAQSSWHTENSMSACGHITEKLGHFRDWPASSTKKSFSTNLGIVKFWGFLQQINLRGC